MYATPAESVRRHAPMLPLVRGALLSRTVAAVASEMTEERLHEALAAWNTADAERVLAFWSDDCVYHASFGPELMGRTFAGRERRARASSSSSTATRTASSPTPR